MQPGKESTTPTPSTAMPLFGDWMKLISQFSSPQLRLEQLIAAQQRNYETMNKVAELAAESMNTVFRRQLDAVDFLAKDGLSVFNQLVQNGTPKEKVALQTEWAKDRLEKGISSLREISGIVIAANAEAGNVLTKRLSESIGELSASLAS